MQSHRRQSRFGSTGSARLGSFDLTRHLPPPGGGVLVLRSRAMRAALALAALAVLLELVRAWLSWKSYLFNQRDIADLTKQHAGADFEVAFSNIIVDLRKKYPGHILPDEHLQWIFVNSRGFMGSMCLLHASLTEYLLLFGTTLDAGGHSGRFWANVSYTIISGSFQEWKEGTTKSQMFYPGDTVVQTAGEAASFHCSAGTWMVSYGYGCIFPMLGHTIADTLFSTQDFVTLFHIVRSFTRCLLLEAYTFLFGV